MLKLKVISKFRTLALLACCLGATLCAAAESSSELKVGKVVGKHIFGLARDVQNDPLLLEGEPLIYEASANNAELTVGNRQFRVDIFDHDIGGVYLSQYNDESSLLTDTSSMSLGTIGGVHSATQLSKTAWNTLTFSEYKMIDARYSEEFASVFNPYFKGNSDLVKPYQYGWLNEVIVLDEKGNAKQIKVYAAGRLFASSYLVMPDNKTVYSHDANSGNLYVFIAEEANSFAKGSLYVVNSDGAISLVELGKSSALKMKFKLKKVDFSKLYKKGAVSNGSCEASFTYIDTVYGKECLKVQKKNRKYVGQFEPIRASAMKGVQPLLPEVESIRFDRNKNEIIVVDNRAQEKRYSLVNSAEYGSNFIIQ